MFIGRVFVHPTSGMSGATASSPVCAVLGMLFFAAFITPAASHFDFLPRLKAGDSYSASLMGHRGSVGSRFAGDGVVVGRGQPPSHIASTGV